MTQQPFQSSEDSWSSAGAMPYDETGSQDTGAFGDAADREHIAVPATVSDEPVLREEPVFRAPIQLEPAGDRGVDEALAPLLELADAPIAEQPDIYERVHADLGAALDELEQSR